MTTQLFPQRLCFPCAAQASDPDPDVGTQFCNTADPDTLRFIDVAPDKRWSFVQKIAQYPGDHRHVAVFVHNERLPLFSVTDRGGTPYCARHAAAYAMNPDRAGKV